MQSGVIVVGAGGHAKVCIELLEAMGERVDYCIGNENGLEHCLNIPVLKGDHHLALLKAQGYHKAFVAIGANPLREQLSQQALDLGYELINAISPSAVISKSAKLGIGVAVMAGAVINAETIIEDFVIINTGATIDHDCFIQKSAHLAPQCALAGNVFVGSSSFLGVGCKVIPQIIIGKNATIGAGAVVIRDISAGVKAVGIPAMPLRHTTGSID